MSERNINNNRKSKKKTTFWDFLIALGGGFVNLLRIERIICLVILYLIARDFYFTINIEKGEIYRENVVDAATILKLLLENNSYKDIIYIAVIAVLVIIVLVLVIIIKCVYKKEINRLARERSRLLHDIRYDEYTPLKKHISSGEER